MFEYLAVWALVMYRRGIFCNWFWVSGSSSSACTLRKSGGDIKDTGGTNIYRRGFLLVCNWIEHSSDFEWSGIAIFFRHVWEARNAVRNCVVMLHPLCTMVKHVVSQPLSAPSCEANSSGHKPVRWCSMLLLLSLSCPYAYAFSEHNLRMLWGCDQRELQTH